MSELILLSDQERKIMQLDTSEATISDIEEFKKSPNYRQRLVQLKSTDAWSELVKRLEEKATVKQELWQETKWLLNAAKSWAERLISTEWLGAFDQATYVYGVLLRHGVMPDRNIGILNVSPDSPLWLQKVFSGVKYGLDKVPIIKHLDFPADMGRATYMYPTKLRNFLADQIGKVRKDEFDAILMALSREKDYHQKLLAAVGEISRWIQWSNAQKETVEWIKSVTAQKESLEAMLALVRTGNPDKQWLVNHLVNYVDAKRAYDMTEFGKIMTIHHEIDPTRKAQMITDLRSEINWRYRQSRREYAKTRGESMTADKNIRHTTEIFEWASKKIWQDIWSLEREKRILEWDKTEIDRKITRNEASKNAILSGKSSSPDVVAQYDKAIWDLEIARKNKQWEIDARIENIESKKKELLDLQEAHTKKIAELQSNLGRARASKDTWKAKFEETTSRIKEQYAVADNIARDHYTTASHQEAGAERYTKATGSKDPHIASMETTLILSNTPENVSKKKAMIQAELQNPDITRLKELERRWLLADFQNAAASVESLSKWAEETFKKLQSGTTPEHIKSWEEFLRNFGESVKVPNDQIGAINDRMLSSWTKLPKIDQDALLKATIGTGAYGYISRLAAHDAAMKSQADWMQKKVSHSVPMRFMYWVIGIVAAGTLITELSFWNKETAINDMKDMAYGFMPGYDLYRAWDGTDLNGRPLKWWDRFERAAWGTLTVGAAVATLGASSLVIGWLRTWVKWVKAANTLWNIVKIGSSGMAVASVSHFGYNLVWMNWQQVWPKGEKVVRVQ